MEVSIVRCTYPSLESAAIGDIGGLDLASSADCADVRRWKTKTVDPGARKKVLDSLSYERYSGFSEDIVIIVSESPEFVYGVYRIARKDYKKGVLPETKKPFRG